MIFLNTPITIEGQPCILMRDVLGGAPSDKYTSQEQSNLRVWYEEEALRETHAAHPKIPVYGFWQSLIASGLIDTSKPLQYIYTTDSRDFGYYLYSQDGQLHTGSLFNEELQRLPGLAIQEGITIDNGEEITVSITDLKLPKSPLLTHKERIQAIAANKKKAQQQGFFTVALVSGIALLIDTGLAYHHDDHMDKFNQFNAEHLLSEQALAAVYRQKLAEWPEQSKALSSVYQVSTTFADSKVSGEISLLPNKTPSLEVEDTRDISAKLMLLADKGIQSTRQSASTTILKWVNDEAY